MNSPLPPDVVEAYVFANTPAYLYRKLVTNSFTDQLATRSDDDLLGYISAARPDNLETVAGAYAALLALLRKGVDLSDEHFQHAFQKLDWAESIVKLFREKFITASSIKIAVPKVIQSTASYLIVNPTVRQTVVITEKS